MKQRTNFRTRLLSEFSDVAAGALDAPAAILTVAESSGEMIIATTGLDLPPDGSGSPTLPSFHSELLLGTEPVLVPDARASVPRQHIEGASFEIRAWLGVPIVRRRRGIRAALSVFSAEPRHWSDDDVALGKELAAAAVEHLDLESALAAAESALRARDDTIRLISHDLRNPLNAIQLTAALLLESGEERRHETVERLELIRRVAMQMNDLIQDLLDASVMDTGEFNVERLDASAARLVEQACELLAPIAETRNIRLAWRTAQVARPIHLDERQMLRVFSNVIGNAIKFTPEGGSIEVGMQEFDDRVEFSITDSGPGIPESDLPHVFRPFWQGRPGDRRGVGLGLVIARGIVEAHGGTIRAESRPGSGATFCFALPFADAARPVLEERAADLDVADEQPR